LKKSICLETVFTEVPFENRFALAKKAGFDYVEFWSWKDKDIEAVARLLKDYELSLSAFSGDRDFSLVDESQLDAYIAFAVESAKTSAYLGCPNLVIHSNALGDGGKVVNHYSDTPGEVLNANMYKGLQALDAAAQKYDVTFVLEALNTKYDHAGNFLKYTKDAAALIRKINSAKIKILYDVYHMQIMEGDIVNTIREYVDTLGYVHIADVPGRGEPGTGEINFKNVVKALEEKNYRGFIGFELFPEKSTENAVKAIMEL
jgi:hydroxypyruvate isomerase